MRLFIFILSLLFPFLPTSAQPKHEVRAAWVTAVYGLDWPRTRATTPQTIRKQKEELTDILDKLKAANFNTVLFQTRTRGDVLYTSAIEPFNSILTGKTGGNPGYDPLAFAVEECHKRGIRIILDFVMNHTSSQHLWFTQACEYLEQLPQGAELDEQECPYVGYYHFANEQKQDYYQVKNTDWYYEGVFWSEMPDLNLENEQLRAELEQIASYWIGMGIDGFRMDAAMHFEENDATTNTEILNWLYEYCLSQNPDFYMVSEVWANEATVADYYASGTPSMFNFDLADKEGKLIKAARGTYKAANLVQSMLKYQTDFAAKNPDYIDAPFITNHDMGRVANALRNDPDDLKMAGGLLMTLSGNPFVYYGEEIGMSSAGTKDENKRLPFIWSDTDTAGMTKGPKDAEAGITSAFAGVEEQQADSDSILNYYKRALRLRNENPELARGIIEAVETLCDGHQAVNTKTWEDSTIAVVYNTSDEAIEVKLTGSAIDSMAIRGYLTLHGEAITLENGVLTMPAQSICIMK